MAAGAGYVDAASPGGWLHDSMGFVVFIIAFCLMFFLEVMLHKLPGRDSQGWLTSTGTSAA
jgi:hypothetical protein